MHFLRAQNVRHVFGYQGSSVTHLIDSLHKVEGLTYIQNYHEQASSFSADAYARVHGGLGVSVATSGPGATNLVTGIASSFFDSVPCLFITGQVSTHAIKTRQAIRQQSFQETDIVSIARPITKFAETVLVPEEIRYCLEKATFLAQSGRPGSVLVDIPHNVQASDVDPKAMQSFYHSEEHAAEMRKHVRPDSTIVRQIVTMLGDAKRPVVLAGGGMASVRGTGAFRTLVHACDLPVVASLKGLDALGHDDEHFCGFIGSYGHRHANAAIAESDLLLVLGSRLDERQTGEKRTLFAEGARIIHVDVDPHELNHNVREAVSVCCDVGAFLTALLAEVGDVSFNNAEWLERIHRWEAASPRPSAHPHGDVIDPNDFLHLLSKEVADDAVVCADVGQNVMWVAQSFRLSGDRQLLTSGGHGAMGYSLPAGIGAHFASPVRQTICVMGDGGIQMNLQELQTISREQTPVKVFVMNNMSLGMIRDYQTDTNKECIGSVEGYANPDFGRIASAFDIPYTRLAAWEDAADLNRELGTDRPHLFEVVLSPNTHVLSGFAQ